MNISNQALSLLRAAGLAIGTTVTIVTVFGHLDPQQQADLSAGLKQMIDGASQFTLGLTKIIPILSLAAMAVFAKFGWNAAGLPAQVKSVQTAAPAALAVAVAQVSPKDAGAAVGQLGDGKLVEAMAQIPSSAIIAAATKDPTVKQVVTTDRVANTGPLADNPKVVSSANT